MSVDPDPTQLSVETAPPEPSASSNEAPPPEPNASSAAPRPPEAPSSRDPGSSPPAQVSVPAIVGRPEVSPHVQQRIDEACALIGKVDDENDYRLDPSGHAVLYRETGELAALLRWPEVEDTAKRYVAADGAAGAAQRRYLGESRHARTAVLTAGLCTAALLAVGVLSGTWPGWLKVASTVALTLGGIAASAWGFASITTIRSGGLLREWMRGRSQAETLRLRYFELVASDGKADPLLLFEYFRRYQLRVQLAYFRARAADHRRDAENALKRGKWMMALGAAATGAAGALTLLDQRWSALAAVALGAQALTSYNANLEATAQWRRNAERYEKTFEALDAIHSLRGRVATAVADGDRGVLREFVATVHAQLSAEHREWLSDLHGSEAAVERLEALLKEYEKQDGGAA